MKFVKCDKCGKVMPITLVDSDYLVISDDGIVIFDPNADAEIISETQIAGKSLDLCTKCYKELSDKKKELDDDFVKQCSEKREANV